MSVEWRDTVQLALRRASGRGGSRATDAPRTVEHAGWVAVAACLALLIVLRIPLGHGATVESTLLHAINATMARLPFIDLQSALLNGDLPQLIIAVAGVALWFRRPLNRRFQSRVIIAVLALFPTYAIARVVQHLDQRVRPLVDQPLQTVGDPATFHAVRSEMTRWGSFPSDHAALLAIVTLVAFMVGRRAGLVALALSAYSCLFRVAYGYHWPGDIVGGVLLGLTVVLTLRRFRAFSQALLERAFAFIDHRPAVAAAIGTILVTEFADGFEYLKLFASLGLHARLFH